MCSQRTCQTGFGGFCFRLTFFGYTFLFVFIIPHIFIVFTTGIVRITVVDVVGIVRQNVVLFVKKSVYVGCI